MRKIKGLEIKKHALVIYKYLAMQPRLIKFMFCSCHGCGWIQIRSLWLFFNAEGDCSWILIKAASSKLRDCQFFPWLRFFPFYYKMNSLFFQVQNKCAVQHWNLLVVPYPDAGMDDPVVDRQQRQHSSGFLHHWLHWPCCYCKYHLHCFSIIFQLVFG